MQFSGRPLLPGNKRYLLQPKDNPACFTNMRKKRFVFSLTIPGSC